ncbi:MAG: ribosomal rRNA E-loop binding protein Ctc/L25/TL5 [Frankiales bacterium]|nr:ribosomal rRNA E-loop binding protein Ctc/L25/TL5 [Frankiales bacterium]
MSEVRIVAEPRTEFGKGAARRVRRAAKVPAVLYGHGDAPRHVSLPGHELMLALKSDSNVLLTLETEDGDQLALPKVVVRDPIKGFLEHVDLIAVRKGEKVTVEVPIVLVGEAAPETLVDQQHMTLSVTAEATHLPAEIELSIAGLSAGDSITAGQVKLPQGTTLELAADAVVVAGLGVISEAALEAELEAAEEELGSGQAGAAAAADEEPVAERDESAEAATDAPAEA